VSLADLLQTVASSIGTQLFHQPGIMALIKWLWKIWQTGAQQDMSYVIRWVACLTPLCWLQSSSMSCTGIGLSNDKVLQSRALSYADTQRYRIGTNYQMLPINAPKCPFHNSHENGRHYL